MQLPLAANYFELISRPDMHMLQVRIINNVLVLL